MAWSLQADEIYAAAHNFCCRIVFHDAIWYVAKWVSVENCLSPRISIFCSARHENISFTVVHHQCHSHWLGGQWPVNLFHTRCNFPANPVQWPENCSRNRLWPHLSRISAGRVQNWCNKPASYAYSSSKQWMSSDIFPKTLLLVEQKRPTQKFS